MDDDVIERTWTTMLPADFENTYGPKFRCVAVILDASTHIAQWQRQYTWKCKFLCRRNDAVSEWTTNGWTEWMDFCHRVIQSTAIKRCRRLAPLVAALLPYNSRGFNFFFLVLSDSPAAAIVCNPNICWFSGNNFVWMKNWDLSAGTATVAKASMSKTKKKSCLKIDEYQMCFRLYKEEFKE